jgi:hypothetical protein
VPAAWSRRKPFPWSLRLNGVGLMVADELVGRQVQSMANSIPNSQEYGTEDLYTERSAPFRGPLLGMGEAHQRSHQLNRYFFGHNAWTSGMWRGKGPRWNPQTPPVTGAGVGPVLGLFAGRHGAAPGEAGFALCGRYVLRRVDDSTGGLVVSRDAGTDTFVHESAERFWHAGAGASDNLYVAGRTGPTDALGELWRYDGATWSEAPVPARFLLRLGDRLTRAWGNQISQCSADPMVAENWTGGVTVGDGSDVISGLAAANGILVIFTRTGRVFTLQGDASWNDVFPGLRRTPPADPLDAPGGQAASWLNAIWFRNGDAFYRLDVGQGMQLQDIGPGRLVDNASAVRGPVQCFAGHQDWFAFQGVYNPADGNSYLLQYGDWVPQDGSSEVAFSFFEGLQGAVVVWPGKRVTAMQTSALFGGNPRLYVGFADGGLGWLDLPRSGPNPFAADSGCTFTTEVSHLTWPLHTLLASGDMKEYLSVSAYGPRVTPGDFLRVSYWLDPEILPQTAEPLGGPPAPRQAGPGDLTRVGISGQQLYLSSDLTSPGLAVEFPASSFAHGILLREEYLTDQSGHADAVGTPVVAALVLKERLHPKLRLQFDFTVLGGNRIARRDGVREQRNADQLRSHIWAAARDPKTITLETPDEVTQGFSRLSYGETLANDWRRYGCEWAIPLSLLQFRTESVFGTIDRLQDLTIDGLGERSIDDLGTL